MSNELYNAEHLYDLLPDIYRHRDAEHGYPLRDLVTILAREARVVARDIERLHDNSFVETAEPWAVHYLGELLGVRGLRPDRAVSPRAEVANTLAYRRRKGTAAVLEQLARDVTGHPARVVEAFQLLAWSQFIPNHVRHRALATANIRHADAMALVDGPFDGAAHSVDIGRPEPREGLHNIPSVGLFLFRLKSLPQLLTSPSVEDANLGYFRFSTLGADAPLFSHPQAETGPASIAEERHVPVAIRRRALHADLGTGEDPGPDELYVGPGRSIAVWVPEANPADGWRPLDAFYVAAHLDPWDRAISGNPGPDNPPAGVVAIDPVLGRLRFEDPTQVPVDDNGDPVFRLGSYHGFSDTLGGGQYDRSPLSDISTIPDDPEHRLRVGDDGDFDQLGPALLQAWPADGDRLIDILDSQTYRLTLTDIEIPAGRRLVLRAADRRRPTVVLENPVEIVGGAGSRLEIDGLWISGHGLTVVSPPAGGDGLDTLHLRHTTLVPGHSLQADGAPASPGAVSLRIETDETEATLEQCILGGIRTAPETRVELLDSIVDVHDPEAPAFAGLGPSRRFGGPLTVRQCTVFGRIDTAELALGENSIFLGPVIAERRQVGCVRFSWVPLGSRVPRRYRCRPQIPDGTPSDQARRLESRERPILTSSRYGRPAYAQLHRRAAEVIRRGADNGSEMGVFCRLQWPLREDDLRLRMNEYLPATLEAGFFYGT